ncbi:hypothetical protein StoSoilB5_18510 [Arthrobacter sp. StoSoilB5]|nr:hypothetical protein StoSoilB5_18510 [Arthrobacter sp. StoSoilB5]
MASAAPEATARKSVGFGATGTAFGLTCGVFFVGVVGIVAEALGAGAGAEAADPVAGATLMAGAAGGQASSRTNDPGIMSTVSPSIH